MADAELNVKPDAIMNTPQIDDVVGKPREFIDDLILNIQGEDAFYAMGTQPDKAFLLTGPPGTGKTFAVRAINNHMNSSLLDRLIENTQKGEETNKVEATDFGLMVFSYDLGRYGTAYINMNSRRVQAFFDKVGTYANCGIPVMAVIDECDAVLTSRQERVQSHTEDRKLLETIMTNLQRAHDTPRFFVTMMTNLPDVCDQASLRAGRIDRKIKFDLPDQRERETAFNRSIQEKCERAGYSVIRRYTPFILAQMSEGFSYADIWTTVNSAVKKRVIEMIKDKSPEVKATGYVTQKGIEEAIKTHKETFLTKQRKIGYGNSC